MARNLALWALLVVMGCTSGSEAGSSDPDGAKKENTEHTEDTEDECFSDPACWCPRPLCEIEGCVGGVAHTCETFGGCREQLPADDCAARGETCWETMDSAIARCAPPGCGDGILHDGETCDEGAENGTRLDACTPECTVPPPAVRDQRHAAEAGETEPLPYAVRKHNAFQTFTAARSGRLAWIVAEVQYGGLFSLHEGGHELLAVSTRAFRTVGAYQLTEHHFLAPVRIEAGKQYAFALQCDDLYECEFAVTRGDAYPQGALVFRAFPGDPEPTPAPADADMPFETWIIEEDDGCAPADAPRCVLDCEEWGAVVRPTCVAGVWACGDGYVIYEEACMP